MTKLDEELMGYLNDWKKRLREDIKHHKKALKQNMECIKHNKEEIARFEKWIKRVDDLIEWERKNYGS